MAEVDTGDQTFIQGTQLQHLLQISQLVDLAHGLRTQGDVPEARPVAGGDDLPAGEAPAVSRASFRLRFISAPEWITIRSAPIQEAARQAPVIYLMVFSGPPGPGWPG